MTWTPTFVWLAVIAAGMAVVVLLSVPVWGHIRRLCPGAVSRLLPALRLTVMLILGLLCWQVFLGGHVRELDEDQGDNRRQVVVLQDVSLSMDFRSAEGRPRAELADEAWEEFRAAAGSIEGIDCRRILFARGTADPDEGDTLRRDGTELAEAVTRTLSRGNPAAILVLSDGVSTDGNAPDPVLRWAGNRGIGLYAVVCERASGGSFDASISRVSCRRVNPARLVATITCAREPPDPTGTVLTVVLTVDGQEHARMDCSVMARQDVVFRLSGLAAGWHEFGVRLTSSHEEATAANNHAVGVFRISADRMLVLVDTPRMETLKLVRLMRREFGERVCLTTVSDTEAATLDPSLFSLGIIADVNPVRVPPVIMAALRQRRWPYLLLAGRHNREWNGVDGVRLPIALSADSTNVGGGDDDSKPLAVIAEVASTDAFAGVDLGRLPLHLLYTGDVSADAESVLAARVGRLDMGFLVADSVRSPTAAVLCCDTTWKWAVHPRPEIRRAYTHFWICVLDWLGASDDSSTGLRLTVEDGPGAGEALVSALVADEYLADVEAVRIRVGEPDQAPRQETAPLVEGKAVRRVDLVSMSPAVVWFEAFAQAGDDTLHSDRVPLVLAANLAETARVDPAPEILRAFAGDSPGHMAAYDGREEVYTRLLGEIDPREEPVEYRERDPVTECALGLLLLMVMGAEWLVERRANASAGLS